MSYRLTDHFCGAGGSSEGADQVDGIVLHTAANHWQPACDTYEENHPEAKVWKADLNVLDPSFFPYTELAWFSPECPNFSQAKGIVADQAEDDLWGETLPTEAAARSRASMWDVMRFAEHHRYLAFVVENVVEVAKWGPQKSGQIFRNWLATGDRLGYDHEIVCVNSMHASQEGLPAPQSRDRIYVVFWQKGNRRPDLSMIRRPGAFCTTCEQIVYAVQSWKRPDNVVGRYRQQYIYVCPNDATVVEPWWVPASTIIDWSNKGERIGDREKPLAEKTRQRVAAGIARYWGPLTLEAAGATYDSTAPTHPRYGDPDGYVRAWPVTDPMKTMHASQSKALAVPVEGREGKQAKSTDEAMRTQTARNETGLAFISHLKGTNEGQIAGAHSPVTDPLHTVAASGNHHALVTPYYGTAQGAKPTSDPVGTITATDRYALIMRNNKGGAEMTTPVTETIRTITTAGHQSVLTASDIKAALDQVDNVHFRMLEPDECKRAMAFPPEYRLLGSSKRIQVRLAGNAVCPPNARDILAAVVRSLEPL